MIRQNLFLMKPAVAIVTVFLLIGSAVFVYSNPFTQWSPPQVTSDSLAREAQRKLANISRREKAGIDSTKVGQSTADIVSASETYIVINTQTNRLYLRTRDSVIYEALCSTGTGAELTDSEDGRHWRFDTPKGLFHVESRSPDPWWRKPDWAFIEEGKRPPADESERLDPEALGDYAIGFGDGFYIHGTAFERLIGVSVTHGCVRLAGEDLKVIYSSTQVGMPIIVF